MKTYVLMISKVFPFTHSLNGQPTNFYPKIVNQDKKHTIRANYELWKKRIDEVNQGLAVISLREWSIKPYFSKQTILQVFGKGEIGVQKLTVDFTLGYFINDIDSDVTTSILAENDGLTGSEFKEWFRKVKNHDELAIIHFTDLRY